MNYYLLKYYLVDDYITKRMGFRESHLKLVNVSYEKRDLIMAGALSDPADEAIIIFKVSDKSIIEEFVNKDPYVLNGLIKEWEIRNWNVVIGKD